MSSKKRSNGWRRRHKQKWWLIRRQPRLLLRHVRRKRREGHNVRLHVNRHTRGSFKVSKGKTERITVDLPAKLDFDENYEETASHFRLLREAVSFGQRIHNLKFEKIRYISPSAALVLASEVDRWNQKIGGQLRASLSTWDDNIRRLLCQMGYFELLGIEKPVDDFPPGNTNFLPFKRGEIRMEGGGRLAKELRQEIEALVGHPIRKHLLFEGLSEAITNVGQHAYEEAGAGAVRQWWLSASYDSESTELVVMFYDQGVGIPRTLPKSDFFEHMKAFFKKWTDSQKIEAAMIVGRTSSGRKERGKGLSNLEKFAKSHDEGKLSIYSLHGMYRQLSTRVSGSSTTETVLRDHSVSVGGTLIEWAVKLKSK
jgi:hypothetical protein